MLKGGIKTAHNKSLKKSYKHLTKRQYKIVKMFEDKEQAEKYLYGYNGFYKTVKRLSNGQVDWDSLTEKEIDLFEIANKTIEKFNKLDDDEVKKALDIFNKTQFKFGQSF